MRTTLTIDDDVLLVAKGLADRQGKTLGDVISSLARQGLRGDEPARAKRRNGVQLIAPRRPSRPVTLELVNRLRDDLP